MKLIAIAETFSENDQWTEYEILKHGGRYRISATENGLGGFLSEPDNPQRWWAKKEEVKDLLLMDRDDRGTVTIVDEGECNKILE
jgi:hypothetical protein